MKKNKLTPIILTLALVMMLAASAVPAYAAQSTTVYVTISNGSLMLTERAITVTDIDGDGALTINDALVIAHNEAYEGGAAAGYASAAGTYGLAITKLWGVENGGSYGYYVNDKSAMGLTDPVTVGDRLYAFVYTDTASFSDVYCYFDNFDVSAAAGDKVTLTLLSAGYDANWQPVTKPVEGAAITIDGTATGLKTDAEGKVTVTFDAEGNHIVSAVSDTARLVPPVCTVTVSAKTSPVTGDGAITVAGVGVAALALLGTAIVTRRRHDAE